MDAKIPLTLGSTDYVNIYGGFDLNAAKHLVNSGKGIEQAAFLSADAYYPVTSKFGLGGKVSTNFTSPKDADVAIKAKGKLFDDALKIEAAREFSRSKNHSTASTDIIRANLGLGNLDLGGQLIKGKGFQNKNVHAKYPITDELSAMASYYDTSSNGHNDRGSSIGLGYMDNGWSIKGTVNKETKRQNNKPYYGLSVNKKF